MPIYEFVCEQCGEHLELLVRGGASPEKCGKHCQAMEGDYGQGTLKRVVSRPAAVTRPEHIGHEGPTAKQAGAAGFGVYKKTGDGPGHYRKESGPGPDSIQR